MSAEPDPLNQNAIERFSFHYPPLLASVYPRFPSPGSCSPLSLWNDFDRTMIVTVVAVRMMEMALNQIIDVVTMGHCLVSATGTVVMTGLVAVAMVLGRTTFRILSADFQGMLLDDG